MIRSKPPSNKGTDALIISLIPPANIEPAEEVLVSLKEIVHRLRVAVVEISSQCHPFWRNVIDQYLPHISPSQIERADTEFPRTVRRHEFNPSRCQEGREVGSVLCFHIGNAILAYYDAVHPANRDFAVGCLELLEDIANMGLGNFCVYGDVQAGYYLNTA